MHTNARGFMPSLIAGAVSFALVLLEGVSHVDSAKFGGPPPVAKKQVKVSFDDASLSFWDPFKYTGFNLTAAVLPVAEELGRRGPGYVAYAAVSTGLGLFLPPKALTAVNVVYVAGAVARSRDSSSGGGGVESFCRDEGRLLLGMPSLHLAAVGSALRIVRFRLWRRLFVRATLFRLRYQLRFMRLYRPRWMTRGTSPLALIVQDTAHAARSVQGLLPDLCHQAAFVAVGCDVPYWSDCSPPPRIEKGWGALRRLDRLLKREFGAAATRVRSRDTPAPTPGLPEWRTSHRIILGTAGALTQSGGAVDCSRVAEPPNNHFVLRRSGEVRGGQAERRKRASAATPRRQRQQRQQQQQQDSNVIAEELLEEYAAVLYSATGEEEIAKTKEIATGSRQPGQAPRAAADAPERGPLVRFHNVTTVASRGSTLAKSYRALAELPYGDGRGAPGGAAPSSSLYSGPKTITAGEASGPAETDDEIRGEAASPPPLPPLVRRPPSLQPVVIKRTVPRQLLLAEDDIAAARRVLRRLVFNAEIDLDLSGVLAEVAAAVARAGDLRSEAESIEKVRSNLARAGMLGSAVGVPEVVSCPELGPLARENVLVTTALRGVDVSDTYVMQHAAPRGERERIRFVDVVFKAFAHMCLTDGCFPSNPMPENLLYMYSGQVGLTDLSSVSELDEAERLALCRLYRALAELKGVDASNPSEAAELKARAAMEGVGLVIDLPPAGGIPRTSCAGWTAEEAAALSLASVAERAIDEAFGDTSSSSLPSSTSADSPDDGKDKADSNGDDRDGDDEALSVTKSPQPPLPPSLPLPPPPPTRPPLTYVMILRGLFDTQRGEALALLGDGGGELLRGMAVRRLPRAMAPVLRMVANLRGICAHLDVDKSILPRFSRAASKGLSWRHAGLPEL